MRFRVHAAGGCYCLVFTQAGLWTRCSIRRALEVDQNCLQNEQRCLLKADPGADPVCKRNQLCLPHFGSASLMRRQSYIQSTDKHMVEQHLLPVAQ